jgi:hypothetical protein
MTKQEAIATINASFPSIWSKDDVLQLINKIDEGTGSFNSEKLIDKIREAVDNAINNMSNDEVVDVSSTEFSIRNGNEIEIDSIGINTNEIVDNVMTDVVEAIEDYIEEQLEYQTA